MNSAEKFGCRFLFMWGIPGNESNLYSLLISATAAARVVAAEVERRASNGGQPKKIGTNLLETIHQCYFLFICKYPNLSSCVVSGN